MGDNAAAPKWKHRGRQAQETNGDTVGDIWKGDKADEVGGKAGDKLGDIVRNKLA